MIGGHGEGEAVVQRKLWAMGQRNGRRLIGRWHRVGARDVIRDCDGVM